ncbi:MAG: FAD:protein FMN transferase [Actinomycetota bacterium]|nr:FAD:protein FMN transferase [Actinomycetota bacterium]MDQ2959155.1 FAD:protein FMN transferase [Actinomycetota bacterium]
MTALAQRVRDRTATHPTTSWHAWSCQVRLVVTAPDALEPAAADLAVLLDRVDRAASRFRIDSELNWANANAGRPIAISRLLVMLLDTALGEARRSDGALDPTLGRDLQRLGYDRDISLVGDLPAEVAGRAAPAPSWRDVRLDRSAGLVTVPAGSALDLGASAKSQTADWAASQLAERYGCSVLVELGGDVAVAGTKADWQLTVAERAGGPGARITLRAGGLATSTSTIRRWRAGSQQLHHLIDPATGQPATGPWRTVTVAAESAVHANTCSTSAIVLGDAALPWLQAQQVAARLVDVDGAVVTMGGWPPC